MHPLELVVSRVFIEFLEFIETSVFRKALIQFLECKIRKLCFDASDVGELLIDGQSLRLKLFDVFKEEETLLDGEKLKINASFISQFFQGVGAVWLTLNSNDPELNFRIPLFIELGCFEESSPPRQTDLRWEFADKFFEAIPVAFRVGESFLDVTYQLIDEWILKANASFVMAEQMWNNVDKSGQGPFIWKGSLNSEWTSVGSSYGHF